MLLVGSTLQYYSWLEIHNFLSGTSVTFGNISHTLFINLPIFARCCFSFLWSLLCVGKRGCLPHHWYPHCCHRNSRTLISMIPGCKWESLLSYLLASFVVLAEIIPLLITSRKELVFRDLFKLDCFPNGAEKGKLGKREKTSGAGFSSFLF